MSKNNLPPEKVTILKGEESLLLDHNYDGIHELDHVLPSWWLWILYATIVFAIFYAGYYLTGIGPNQTQELASDMSKIEALRPPPPAPGDEAGALLAAFQDPTRVKHGGEVFAGKCAACHGDKGQGIIGPNLTDNFWIHGSGTLKDIAAVVTTGVADKGMPPWGALLSDIELKDVVGFIHSLHGSKPEGAKAPQGDQHEFKD